MPPRVPSASLLPAVPRAFTNSFLEISRQMWCTVPLTQRQLSSSVFQSLGFINLESFFTFSTRIFLGLLPFPRAAARWLLLERPLLGLSSQPRGQLPRGGRPPPDCFAEGKPSQRVVGRGESGGCGLIPSACQCVLLISVLFLKKMDTTPLFFFIFMWC